MKKPIAAFAGLVLAAGASVGAYLAVKNDKKKEDEKAAERAASLVLFNFDADSINKLSISCPDGDYTIEKEENTWDLVDGGSFDVEQDYITLICDYVSNLTAKDSFGDGDKASYGLDSPSTIVLSNGSESYTLGVGDVSPTGDFFYVTANGKDEVYSVPTINGQALILDYNTLHSKELIPYNTNDITGYEFVKDGKSTLSLNYTGGDWKLPAGYEKFSFDYSAVTSLSDNVTSIEVQGMVEKDPSDLSKYGLDKPYAEATIKCGGDESRMLISAPYDENRYYCYVLRCSENQVMKCYVADMDFVDKRPFDFLVDLYKNPDYSELSSLELTFNGREDKFEFGDEKGSLNGKEFEYAYDFDNFYSSLSTLKYVDVDVDAKPELKDPVLTAVYRLKDGTERVYQLADAGDKKLYVFFDGEYSGGLLSSDDISGKNSLPVFFETFRDSAGLE